MESCRWWLRCAVLVATSLPALGLLGCSSSGSVAQENPIAISLVDLAGESRGARSLAVNYTELFAVNGALMLPNTRMHVYYPVGKKDARVHDRRGQQSCPADVPRDYVEHGRAHGG